MKLLEGGGKYTVFFLELLFSSVQSNPNPGAVISISLFALFS
jgi:hypothetical protein